MECKREESKSTKNQSRKKLNSDEKRAREWRAIALCATHGCSSMELHLRRYLYWNRFINCAGNSPKCHLVVIYTCLLWAHRAREMENERDRGREGEKEKESACAMCRAPESGCYCCYTRNATVRIPAKHLFIIIIWSRIQPDCRCIAGH